MIGNLKMYLSDAGALNLYGECAARHARPPRCPARSLLWMLRVGLIARVRPAHPRRVPADAHEPAGPAASTYQSHARLRRRQLRVPHDALDRHHRLPLPRLPPRRPHVGHGQPATSSAAIAYDNLDRTASSACRSAIVYIVANLALGVPPLPRRLEHVPEPRAQQPAVQQAGGATFAHRLRGDHRASATSASRSRCMRTVDRGVPRTEPMTDRAAMTMTLDAKIPDGPDRREVGQPQVRRSSS